jgi:mRNA interferase YafQ
MWAVVRTSKYFKDFEKMRSRGHGVIRMHAVLQHLQTTGQAPTQSRPHKLSGVWKGYWECHIAFDWLLIYSTDGNAVTLWRTGTHDDLFG